jgi:hypothetical protein
MKNSGRSESIGWEDGQKNRGACVEEISNDEYPRSAWISRAPTLESNGFTACAALTDKSDWNKTDPRILLTVPMVSHWFDQ